MKKSRFFTCENLISSVTYYYLLIILKELQQPINIVPTLKNKDNFFNNIVLGHQN